MLINRFQCWGIIGYHEHSHLRPRLVNGQYRGSVASYPRQVFDQLLPHPFPACPSTRPTCFDLAGLCSFYSLSQRML